MGTEIERKFLVRDPSIVTGSAGTRFRQGYLSRDPDRTVRVRHAGERAWLTVKGRSSGASREEFEYEIPSRDADQLLALCLRPIIEKTRHLVDVGGATWEVDVFEGDNAGLVIAEIELGATDAPVKIPDWAGAEVTGDPRYYNASLVSRPFGTW